MQRSGCMRTAHLGKCPAGQLHRAGGHQPRHREGTLLYRGQATGCGLTAAGSWAAAARQLPGLLAPLMFLHLQKPDKITTCQLLL